MNVKVDRPRFSLQVNSLILNLFFNLILSVFSLFFWFLYLVSWFFSSHIFHNSPANFPLHLTFMKTIDWYILKKFLFTFIFCLLMFTLIAVAVDSSEKMDDFVKAKLTTSQVLTEYYLGFVPFIWNLLFPLFVFIAVIFFTSRMASRSEIIAILASGTSYNRFLKAYVIGGILLSVLLWFG